MVRDCELVLRFVWGASVKLEHEAEGVVNSHEFVLADSSDELAEPLVRYCGRLLDEDLGVVPIDRDSRPEDPRRGRARGRGHKNGGQHQVVGLQQDGVALALLLVTAR